MKLTNAHLQTKVVDLENEVFEVEAPKSQQKKALEAHLKKQKDGVQIPFTPILVPLTVRMALAEAVRTSNQEDKTSPDEGKIIERYHLASEIMKSSTLELTSDEVTLIKERLIKHWASPEVIGFLFGIIDPASLKRK